MRKLQFILILTALLAATITPESLWTDEAFSAFMASHRTLASCWATLVTGDSSDLQMAAYYLYLHSWTRLFGESEIALRTANIPFMLLFSGSLVWASSRIFNSKWAWTVAAIAPLAVAFASDTRPYFDVIAMSLSCVTCLLAYLHDPTQRERKLLPWLVLLLLLVGATFHMLMLLLGVPLIVLLYVFYRADKEVLRWSDWKWPLMGLTPVGVALMAYFAWTFGRGATYDYARPDVLSMASVMFRFAGLSGFAPNRRYDISFRPYVGAMAVATFTFLGGLMLLWLSSKQRVLFKALGYAMLTGIIQVCILTVAVHQQMEFRHMSSLLPLLMLLIMCGLSVKGRSTALAAAAIGVTWLISDVALLQSADYKREDFRSAVRKAIELHRVTNGDIAVVADPIGPAYYGMEMEGSRPCFPLMDSCQEGFAKVHWNDKVPSEYALFWSRKQIEAWLDSHKNSIVLISRGRHPSVKDSPWWPALQGRGNAVVFAYSGFFVYRISSPR